MTAPGLRPQSTSDGPQAAEPPPEPYDLRLVPAAVGAWSAGALVLHTRPLVATGVVAGCLLLAAGAARAARGRQAPAPPAAGWLALTAALACSAAVASVAGLQLQAVRSGPLAELASTGGTATVTAVLLEDPRLLTGRSPGSALRRPLTLVRVRVERLERPGGQAILSSPALVISSSSGWTDLLPGQQVRLNGRLLPPRRGDDVAAVLSGRGPPELQGRPPAPQRAAGRVRTSLRRASDVLPARSAGLLPGLVLGDVSRLDPELNDSFRTAGLTHLTAVSGANVAIVLGVVLLVARQCRAGLRLQALLCAAALLGFVVLVRPSPSVLRAAAMGAVAIAALVSGRPRAALPALCAATLLLLMTDPWLALSLGFALSVSATAGLLTIAPSWRRRLARRLPGWLADAIAVPAAAQAACCPLIAAISGSVSLVAVPANLLAAPLIAPATVVGVLSALTATWCLPLARGLAWLAGIPVGLLIRLATGAAAVPGAAVPWPGGLSGALALIVLIPAALVVLRHRAGRRGVAVAGVAALLALSIGRVVTPAWPPADWRLVVCDVGQGDMLALHVGAGAAVVVDAGPDPDLADTCLRALRVRLVPVLVFSHLHADHVEGLAGVLRGRQVGQVHTGPLDEPAGELARVRGLLAGHGLVLGREAPGEVRQVGPVRWRVLAPGHPFSGTESDPNNSSLVLAVQFSGFTALLTGDVEVPAQQELLSHAELLRADVLKVPHHGSRVQDPAFLSAVHERLAVTSVGAGNDYGHPSADTLGQITATGARSLRTDTDGAIAVTSRSGQLVAVSKGPRSASALGAAGGSAGAGPLQRNGSHLARPAPGPVSLVPTVAVGLPSGPVGPVPAVAVGLPPEQGGASSGRRSGAGQPADMAPLPAHGPGRDGHAGRTPAPHQRGPPRGQVHQQCDHPCMPADISAPAAPPAARQSDVRL